jgi:hypothetical protein
MTKRLVTMPLSDMVPGMEAPGNGIGQGSGYSFSDGFKAAVKYYFK